MKPRLLARLFVRASLGARISPLLVLGACGAASEGKAPELGAATASATATVVVRPNRAAHPPRQLCARERAHIEETASSEGFSLGPVLPGMAAPSASAVPSARAAAPREPSRSVVLVSTLPDDYVIEAIVLPNFARIERVDRPTQGEIARIDARGARGDVIVLVRRVLKGGLYDYVGACETARSFLAVSAALKTKEDITLRVSETGGTVYVDVEGGEPQPEPMLE
jgi:hypothetical protein